MIDITTMVILINCRCGICSTPTVPVKNQGCIFFFFVVVKGYYKKSLIGVRMRGVEKGDEGEMLRGEVSFLSISVSLLAFCQCSLSSSETNKQNNS